MVKIAPSILSADFSRLGEEIKAIEAAGADYVHIDVMDGHFVPNITIGPLIVDAVRKVTDLPLDVHLMIENPDLYIPAFTKAGADIIGTNCGNGMERMLDIVKEMRAAAPNTPILLHANAGLPQNVDGVDVFPETPEMMAAFVDDMLDAGANIIGGCCGTTPAHIAAIKEAVEKHNS